MKNIRKILVCILAALFLFGVVAGCSKEGGETPVTPGSENLAPATPGAWEGGTHEIYVEEGSADFISNGRSDYVIVIPDECGDLVQTAASEISVLVYEASGITLDVVTDAALPNTNYISIGNTQAAASAGVSISGDVAARLGDNGVYVQTKDDNVYIMGTTDTGTLYAAYTWLEYQLGFEVYGADEVVIATDVRDMKLNEMNIIDAPDIQYMQSTYGFTDYNTTLRQRMRITDNTIWLTIGNSPWHNSFKYVDPDIYRSLHPEWYSEDGTQLCYTAHGDSASLTEMAELVAERIESEIIAQDRSYVTITMEDTSTWCTCADCTALNQQYGTDAVSVIRFCNQVSALIDEWFATPEGTPYERDLKIVFFAYHATEPAPVTYDEATDTYAPIDDTVLCADNVGILYAPILATYQKDFYDEYNTPYYTALRGWETITDNIYMWTYSTGFHYYLVPTNTYNSMQANYRLWAEVGAEWLLDQSQYNSIQSTGFCALKLYLNAKLHWNVNYDMEELIDKFFTNYFGPAATTMRWYFDELRSHFLFMEETMDYVGYQGIEPLEQRYWPATLLERWISYCDQAEEDLAALAEEDPTAYAMYLENVQLESLSPRYLLLDLWGNRFSESELTALRNQFRNDCNALEVNRYAEKQAITELWSSWGI